MSGLRPARVVVFDADDRVIASTLLPEGLTLGPGDVLTLETRLDVGIQAVLGVQERPAD